MSPAREAELVHTLEPSGEQASQRYSGSESWGLHVSGAGSPPARLEPPQSPGSQVVRCLDSTSRRRYPSITQANAKRRLTCEASEGVAGQPPFQATVSRSETCACQMSLCLRSRSARSYLARSDVEVPPEPLDVARPLRLLTCTFSHSPDTGWALARSQSGARLCESCAKPLGCVGGSDTWIKGARREPGARWDKPDNDGGEAGQHHRTETGSTTPSLSQ